LRDVGEALYGPFWQSEMARELEVAVRTIQRWLAGDSPIPSSIGAELRIFMALRKYTLDDLINKTLSC